MSLDLSILGNRLLLRPIDDIADKSAGGIIFTQQTQDDQRYRRWEIAVVGSGVQDESLRAGLEVIVNHKFAGEPLTYGGQRYQVVFEDALIATLAH